MAVVLGGGGLRCWTGCLAVLLSPQAVRRIPLAGAYAAIPARDVCLWDALRSAELRVPLP
jgi:hypothetical protein